MAEARERSEWNRASSVMAMVHNAQCARASLMKPPAAFNPFVKDWKRVEMTVPVSALKERFRKAGFRVPTQAGLAAGKEVAHGGR